MLYSGKKISRLARQKNINILTLVLSERIYGRSLRCFLFSLQTVCSTNCLHLQITIAHLFLQLL